MPPSAGLSLIVQVFTSQVDEATDIAEHERLSTTSFGIFRNENYLRTAGRQANASSTSPMTALRHLTYHRCYLLDKTKKASSNESAHDKAVEPIHTVATPSRRCSINGSYYGGSHYI